MRAMKSPRPTPILARYVCILSVICTCVAALGANTAHGHGGVVLEEDVCLLKIGFYQAHFTIYQPATSRHEEFCEDLPELGESIFVLEFMHDGLADMPLDFRIVRNTTGMGQFTGADDLAGVKDLDAVTVFYQPPMLEPDVVRVRHEFAAEGEYVGVVTAQASEYETLYMAVFPFEVGYARFNYPALAWGSILTGALIWLALRIGRLRRAAAVAPLVAVAIGIGAFDAQGATPDGQAAMPDAPPVPSYVTRGQLYQVTLTSSVNPLPLNRMHSWRARITSLDGVPVTAARVRIEGGMPEHDHGLPTSPRVTDARGDGTYLIEGVKFHMRGAWELTLDIQAERGRESVIVPFPL